jgi:hypothetical protein
VAISGEYAIVGAHDEPYGAAYTFYGFFKGITLDPDNDKSFFNNLKVNSTNWSGVTESNYFLINTYSGQGSGIMTALYNEHLKVKNENYSLGSGDGYAAGSGDGY